MVANAQPVPNATKKCTVVDVTQFIPTAHAKKMNQKASAALRVPPKVEAALRVSPKAEAALRAPPKVEAALRVSPKAEAALSAPPKAEAASRSAQPDSKKNSKPAAESKEDAKAEARGGGSEVSKLKQQMRNLKKMNDFLSKKLDKMSKGHKELSHEHKHLKDSLRRMTAAEGQLVEELLTKVKEKDMLSSTLQKVLVEKEELELMVESIEMKMDQGSTSQNPGGEAASDSDESAASDIQFDKSFQSSRKFHESFHSDVIFHDSSYSDIEISESFQSDMEGMDGKGEASVQSDVESSKGPHAIRHARSYSEAEFRVEFGGEELTLNKPTGSDGVLASYEDMKMQFKGRGTIRFYSVLDEMFR
ncbi:hypothetical protein BSKO_05030 [Bryopsis sp. KO-2023]|nr:hypothetical protein BSKO_05030 [Bryopsis sp. KO-2023]